MFHCYVDVLFLLCFCLFCFFLCVFMSASVPVHLFAWCVPLTRCPHYTLSIHNSSPCSHPPRHYRSIRLQARLCSHRSERYSNPTTLPPLPLCQTQTLVFDLYHFANLYRTWSLLPTFCYMFVLTSVLFCLHLGVLCLCFFLFFGAVLTFSTCTTHSVSHHIYIYSMVLEMDKWCLEKPWWLQNDNTVVARVKYRECQYFQFRE